MYWGTAMRRPMSHFVCYATLVGVVLSEFILFILNSKRLQSVFLQLGRILRFSYHCFTNLVSVACLIYFEVKLLLALAIFASVLYHALICGLWIGDVGLGLNKMS